MLTQESIDKAFKQQAAYGEGVHRFGGPEPRNVLMQERIAKEHRERAEQEPTEPEVTGE